jgi:hypothetical protein
MCVYLWSSLAVMIFKNWDSTHFQFIVNLVGSARKSDVFKDQSKFSHSSLCSLALASELITEWQQNIMIQENH